MGSNPIPSMLVMGLYILFIKKVQSCGNPYPQMDWDVIQERGQKYSVKNNSHTSEPDSIILIKF
ncbi:MAG TPA: hypothetical protein VFU79_03870 [Nitrososphaeraceae archaeon]|nr:hypothetical protein [Nitrososphaeraceae archaeon]